MIIYIAVTMFFFGCGVGSLVQRLADKRQNTKVGTPSALHNKQMVAALYRELENELLDNGPIKFSDGWVPVTEERLNIAFGRVMQS